MRASAGSAFRVPNFQDMFSPLSWNPNPNLRPERSVGQELAIERPLLKGDYISFRVQDGSDTLLFNGRVSNSRISGTTIRGSEHTRWRALRCA